MVHRLEDLEVYRLAEELADLVWDKCVKWERFARNTLGEQLVRAADSIPANVAKSHGRYSYGEKRQFCYYARGSLEETRNWLRRSRRRELINDEEIANLKHYMDILPPKLNAYINTLKAN